MQLYTNQVDALNASDARTLTLVPYECPYSFEKKACGTWCALFEIAEHTRSADGTVLKRASLRCGDGNKVFMVSE
jgi:hypothetical protein